MQRKYIYIIVFILTIALVLTDYYIGLNTSTSTETAEKLQGDIEDTYKSAEIKSNLVIKNLQNDEQELVYTYKIKIDNVVGAQLATYKDEEFYIIFAANGEAEVTVDSNETLTIKDIPQGANYTIEQITDVSDKYNTTINEQEITHYEGVIAEENVVEFNNETIKSSTPVKKNPYTSDNNNLKVIVLVYAAIIIIVALKFRIKRFS